MWVPLKSRWHRLPVEQAAGAPGVEREEPAGEEVPMAVPVRTAASDPDGAPERNSGEVGIGR